MPHLRLIGLALFITSVFLAMAAAATQTSHIRFKRPSRLDQSPHKDPQSSEILPDGVEPTTASPALHFVSVPVVYPLVAAGTFGLLLWFVPAPRRVSKTRRRRSTRRRRK